MKRGFLVLALSLSLPVYSFAQRGGMGHGGNVGNGGNGGQPVQIIEEMSTLSIFSETGEPFYLVLNGVKQNLVPQSKLRVEALPQYITDVQIQFANSRIPPIRKRIVVSDPLDGKAVSLTLKISSGRGGNAKLEFQRMSGCDHNYRGPGDEYVMYYGKPQQVNTTETTYTDPVTGDMVTQTTTTTTTKDNYTTGYTNPVPPAPMAMSQATFNDVRHSITGASFEDTKLSTAKTILKNNFVNTDQVMEICKLFSFENTKLSFAKYAYNRTVDPNNYYKVASVLDFDSNKKTLNNFISAHPR